MAHVLPHGADTQMSWPHVHDWTGLRSRLGARAEAIVMAWKTALTPAGFVPLSGAEQRDALTSLTDRFLDVLASEPFVPERASSIGADLVGIGYTRPAALQATIDVLVTQLTPELTEVELRELQPRLARTIAELSSGFAHGRGERILADQETIRAALLSQRDRAAQALRESEARFRAIFTASPFGIAMTDIQGRTLTANPALQTMLGYPEDALRDTSVLTDLVHPNDVENATRAFRELTSGRLDRYELEQRFLTRDGRVIWAEFAIVLVRDVDSQPQFAIAMGQDITTRKQAEAERMQLLREQAARAEAEAAQERLTILAEVSEQLASSLDYETTLQQVAQSVVPRLADWCALHLADEHRELRAVATSYSTAVRERVVVQVGEAYQRREDAPESPVMEVFHTGRSRLIAEIEDEALRSVSRDDQYVHLWHQLAPRSAMVVPLRGQRGVLGTLSLVATADSNRRYDQGALALAEDLARRAALAVENARLYAEAQAAIRTAEDAVRAREQFLSVAAHELKTPVTSLRGFAQLTLRALEQDADLDRARLRHALTVVNDQSEKLTRLVAQLLDASRIQSGRLALELQTVDVAQLIRAVVTAMQHQSQYHVLHVDSPPEVPVRMDALRIEQVITNLLDNAIKYSPQGGPIEISVSQDAEMVRVSISDRGPGIPIEHREHIFERFYQAGAEASHAAGMGLGLFISREIVELHGGTISAEFPPTGGATFVVTLPVQP